MNSEKTMVKTPLTFDANYGRLIMTLQGYDAFVLMTKDMLGVTGDLEFSPSPHHDDFDIRVSSEESFRINSKYKNTAIGDELYSVIMKNYQDMKQTFPDRFMALAAKLPVDSAYLLLKHRVVTPDELFDANPSMVRQMAERQMVNIPQERRFEGRASMRLMSFDR